MQPRSSRRVAVRSLLPDVLAVTTGVVVYFGIRGLTNGSPATAVDHAHDVLRLEQAIGLDVEDEVQAALVHLEPVTTLANWVYIWGHWPAIAVTLVWLALRHRPVFRRLRDAMLVSGAMGLCVYTTYPVAPPRLAGLGLVDTVSEQSKAYRVLQPPAFTNQYAAMPSLHVGWDLLVGLALLAAAGAALVRVMGWVMPAAMAVSTVVTANHYVLDVIVGAAFALVGWAVALRLERRREHAGAVQAAVRSASPLVGPPREGSVLSSSPPAGPAAPAGSGEGPPGPPATEQGSAARSSRDGVAAGGLPGAGLPGGRLPGGGLPYPRHPQGGQERREPRCCDRR